MARTYDPITKKIIDLPDERMVGEPGSGAAATEPAKTYPYGGSWREDEEIARKVANRDYSTGGAMAALMSDDDYGTSLLNSKLWQTANEAGRAALHDENEKIKAKYGFSGGANGAEYHPLNQPVRTDTTEHTISDVTQRMAAWDQMLNDPFEDDVRGLAAQMRDYGTFTDPHQAGLDQLESAILNRKPFEYSLDADPAWQAYKKQYAREGRRASEDTLGQYAAMTGGVPSTAAATAAQQAANYYNAQMTDKIPELYKLAYSMYADDASRQLSDLSAIRGLSGDAYNRWLQGYNMLGDNLNVYRGLSGDWYGRQQDAYGRLGDLYNLASGERSYADSRADLAYNRAWNEDERDRARAKEDEANTVYGYGSDGSSYKITSQLGRDFISQARYGDPDMTGEDGSIFHKNADGTVTITRKDGRTYTVSGTPEEWTGLTLAQMWDAIDRATKAGTEIPPNVLKAWEHFMGGSYAGSAPAATGGGYGGGYGGGVTPAAAPVGNEPEYEPLVYEPQTFTPTLMPLDPTFGVNPAPGTIPSAGESASGTGSNLSPAAQQIENTIASFAIGGSTADAQTYAADAIGDALDNGQISDAEADYLLKLFGF